VVIDGALVGSINLRFQVDYLVAEMGWSLHRRLWGQGVVTEAVSAVVESAFRAHPRLTRIGATADTRNVASLRVMEKIGMQREGVLRQCRLSREGLVNEAIYGLLRSDWMRRGGR
jgi:RimJ/RimL family protein N-acetyltransferase